MKPLLLLLGLAAITIAAQPGAAADLPRRPAATAARPAGGLPRFKRHTPYPEVRQRLLALGFKPLLLADPFAEDCTPFADEKRCERFPEIESCSGTGFGFCRLGLIAPDRRWIVVLTTREGPEIGLYDIFYANPGEIDDFKKQMVHRQAYHPEFF